MTAELTAETQSVLEAAGIDLFAVAQDPQHPARAIAEHPCSKCGVPIQCMTALAQLTACDTCREKYINDEREERHKKYWEGLCPEIFRETKQSHPDFPKAQYDSTKDYTGEASLLLYGDTRTGKTRLGTVLLRRCLIRYDKYVGILWPEQLKSVKKAFNQLELIEKVWGRYDVLLMDDALLAGAMDSRVTDWLKDLLDYRMRHKRHHIITSQIGSGDYKEQSGKFAEATGADKKLIEALCARVTETCRVVPFVTVKPAHGEETF